MANRPRVASVDTNVVSAIVRDNEYSAGYLELLTDFDPALTFFVRGELAAANWSRRRADRLAEILRQYESLPDPDFRTINAFTVIRSAARSLGIGKALGSDAWILAQTAALGIPFISHDGNAIRTAKRAGIECHTLNHRALRLVSEDSARIGES